jgi:hypothetical protein
MHRPKLKIWQWIVVALLALTAISWLVHRPDARARQLNDAIEAQASPQLKAYPYQFRVLRTEGNTAVMSTPRNVDVPAFRMLGALYPDIDVKNPNDPAFVAAEQTLAAVQSEARSIVMSQPGITSVRWELDAQWLAAHSIDVPASPYGR